jgi:hypothetical protein
MYFGIGWCRPDNFDLRGHSFINSYNVNHWNYYMISICPLGSMNGLGNITTIPSNGFTPPANGTNYNYNKAVACEQGHGYVVKLETRKKDGSPDAVETVSIEYMRMYVVEPIISTAGGIMGAKVKYQYPFNP